MLNHAIFLRRNLHTFCPSSWAHHSINTGRSPRRNDGLVAGVAVALNNGDASASPNCSWIVGGATWGNIEDASLGLAVVGIFEGVCNLRALAERKEPIVEPQPVLGGGLKLVEGNNNENELVLVKEKVRGGFLPEVLQFWQPSSSQPRRLSYTSTESVLVRGIFFWESLHDS